MRGKKLYISFFLSVCLYGLVGCIGDSAPGTATDLSPPRENTSPPAERPLRILSLDGGGIRGIIIASLLTEIESVTSKHIVDLFDLFAGTSTGGLIAIGVTLPNNAKNGPKYSAQDLQNFYQTKGSQIFKSNCPYLNKFICGARGPLYNAGSTEIVFNELVGENKLNTLLKPTIITAFDIEYKEGVLFDSRKKRFAEVSLLDIAQATSAAPTYFPPKKIELNSDKGYKETRYLVDGGLFNNNPSTLAYEKALEYFGHDEVHRRGIQIFSFGTGEPVLHETSGQDLMTAGFAKWAPTVIGAFLSGAANQNVKIIDDIVKDIANSRHFRIQPKLDNINYKNIMELDNINNVEALLNAAEGVKNSAEFKKVLEALTQE